jgi:hypothetical protein
MIPQQNQQHVLTEDFARYEFKYLLNADQCNVIEHEVAQFMKYDGFVHPELGNRYIVRSLYFDNRMTTHYFDKIDGIRHRRKFRIRTYSRISNSPTPIFLEEKGRHIDRTFKTRIPLMLEDIKSFTSPSESMLVDWRFAENELFQRFVFSRARLRTYPMVLVYYERRPYTSAFDLNFRITFDSHLRATATSELFPSANKQWFETLAGHTVLEVKFHRRVPAWFHRIIKTHNLRRQSISKFCKGMEICGLAQNLS